MMSWKDVTDAFSDNERHWKGRYLEICEVANERIECSLFSCEDNDCEIYVNYGVMYGVSVPEQYIAYEKNA